MSSNSRKSGDVLGSRLHRRPQRGQRREWPHGQCLFYSSKTNPMPRRQPMPPRFGRYTRVRRPPPRPAPHSFFATRNVDRPAAPRKALTKKRHVHRVFSPTHKRTKGRAPVWGSEFTSKDATLQGRDGKIAARQNVQLCDLTGGDWWHLTLFLARSFRRKLKADTEIKRRQIWVE